MERGSSRFGARQLCGKVSMSRGFPSLRGVEGEVQGRGVEPSHLARLHRSDGLSGGATAQHRKWLQEGGGQATEQCLQVSKLPFWIFDNNLDPKNIFV